MDDVRSYLRYLIPGSLFLLEFGLYLLGVIPRWTLDHLKCVQTIDIGGVVGLAIGLGTIGYLLSTIHHVLYWAFPKEYPAVDYVPLVNGLRNRGALPQGNGLTLDRETAWIIVTRLWHERLKTCLRIEGANTRADVFADLVHSCGACRVGSWAAVVTAVLVGTFVARWRPSNHLLDYYISAMILVVGMLLLRLHDLAYRKTLRLSEAFVIGVLEEALAPDFLQPPAALTDGSTRAEE